MKYSIYDQKHNETGESLEISPDVILEEPNEGLAHQLLLLQQTRPFCNANTKTRTEVRGGGRKPWKQKGTGRARAGSLRSPIFKGGGVAHGPRRHYISHTMPKRMRRKALCSALSLQTELINVIDSYPSDINKTKDTLGFINSFRTEGAIEHRPQKVLIVIDKHDEANTQFCLALNNVKYVTTVHWQNLNPFDLFNNEVILVDKITFKRIEDWLITYKTLKKQIIAK